MDESLFIFALLCGFFLLCSIIYCFLSTCLGVQIRRSDLVEAFTLPTPARIRARDAERRRAGLGAGAGAGAGAGYELDDLGGGAGYERLGGPGGIGGMGAEDFEMLRRGGGMGRFY